MKALLPGSSRSIVEELEAAVDVEGLLAKHAAGATDSAPEAIEPPD